MALERGMDLDDADGLAEMAAGLEISFDEGRAFCMICHRDFQQVLP